MALIWAALLFSILVNVAVSTARANESDPVVYDVEAFEEECREPTPAEEQYIEYLAIVGLCDVAVERMDQLARMLQERLDRADARGGQPREVEVVNGEPVAVAEAEPLSMEMTEEAVTAAGQAQKEAIWAFSGLAVGLFFGYALYRQVMARG